MGGQFKHAMKSGDARPGYVPTQAKSQVMVGGKFIKVGDSVSVLRDGWRDYTGMYIGKKKERLQIRFDEHGGALLLCHTSEVRWSGISVVEDEHRVAGVEPHPNGQL
jgi:hypothetical protein